MAISKGPKTQSKEIHILAEVAKALTTHLELPELLQVVMERIDDVIAPAEFGLVLLWDPVKGALQVRASCGKGIADRESLHKMLLNADESITGLVYTTQQARAFTTPAQVRKARSSLSDANRHLMFRVFGEDHELRSILAAPLIAGSENYGVLILGTLHGPDDFSENDLPFMQILADLIALAIDRARLETATARSREAEQVDRLRAETMAVLSHELRTPLAAIKGYSTALMLDEVVWEKEKQLDFLRLIDEECDNLQLMITDILDSSLIDIGQISLEYQPVRLDRIASEVAGEMQRRSASHKLLVDFPNDFPIVDADPLRIRQVIRNIVDNAIKYSPNGGLIVIRGEVRPNDIVVSISDQGVGISPEDLIPLFDKYFRVKSPTGYYVPGTGLGLPVARALVEEHNGRIWAESKIAEGTTLYFSIPHTNDFDQP